MSEHLRCGLCQITIIGSWKDHEKDELHQSKLPKKRESVKIPEVIVRFVGERERELNIKECKVAKAEHFGYYPVSNGRSYHRMQCECGEKSDVSAWRRCKRCPNCGKLLHTLLSFALE